MQSQGNYYNTYEIPELDPFSIPRDFNTPSEEPCRQRQQTVRRKKKRCYCNYICTHKCDILSLIYILILSLGLAAETSYIIWLVGTGQLAVGYKRGENVGNSTMDSGIHLRHVEYRNNTLVITIEPENHLMVKEMECIVIKNDTPDINQEPGPKKKS